MTNQQSEGFSEMDVSEVMEGFLAPPAMTPASRREAVRRLDQEGRLSTAEIAVRLVVSTRTVERYRRVLRNAGGA